MLRKFLLYLSTAGWARRMVLKWAVARRVARRFVAGETETEALAVVRELNVQGLTVTLDVLGESVIQASETRPVVANYLSVIEQIEAQSLDSWVSLKLSALGVDIDPDLCAANLREILDRATACKIAVTIDMESSAYTQRTLDLFRQLRAEGYTNLRVAIQAYLFRSDDDIADLATNMTDVRLCKGAYQEPPQIAYPRKQDVDAAYIRQMRMLLDAAKRSSGYPGIATHDEAMIAATRAYVAEQAISLDAFEFQMLYGVRSALQKQLAGNGYQMRVYVPFGTEWFPYFVRRLAERPANLWFFVGNLFRR